MKKAPELPDCYTVGELIDALSTLPRGMPVRAEGEETHLAFTEVGLWDDEEGKS